MKDFLHHFFFPHEHNNYRAKILHNSSLFLVVTLLFFGGIVLSVLRTEYSTILGISSDISVEKLLELTNQERQKNGLNLLKMNDELTDAAKNKVEDMFAENYWAHNSPDGKTPWVFIRGAGYNYIYAGENLARGFDNPQDVLKAWMNSPKHRENILSGNFNDVGFAVRKGWLNGEETVLIVEEFGSKDAARTNQQASLPGQKVYASSDKVSPSGSLLFDPLIKIKSLTLTTGRALLLLFIGALILDMVVVQRKKVVRFVGHNTDHVLFLTAVLLIIGAIAGGVIL